MPEAPPVSVLQTRPATSQPRSRTSVGAMRSRQYTPSPSPPPRNGALQPTPPSRLPTNLLQHPSHYQHIQSANPALRRSTDERQRSCTPDRSCKLTTHPSGAVDQTSSSSRIRHRSTTPVRVTKDAQLRRDEAAVKHKRTPSSQDSPLRRRVTTLARATVAQPSRQSWDGSRGPPDPALKPTPPRHQQFIPAATSASLTRPSPGSFRSHLPKDAPAASGGSAASASTAAAPPVVGLSERVRPPAETGACQVEEQLEGYELGPVIGEGGFCKVKSGRHLASERPVAIKVINKVCTPFQHNQIPNFSAVYARVLQQAAVSTTSP
eukprot:jgi/Ulvmu1/10532/UM064_0070.1